MRKLLAILVLIAVLAVPVAAQFPAIYPLITFLQGITSIDDITETTIETAIDTLGAVGFTGAIDANSGGATGETGIDFNSINSTYSTIAQSDAEGIVNKSDLRIGLDETNRTLILCDRGDIATDFGLTANANPILHIYDATGVYKSRLDFNGIYFVDSFYRIYVNAGYLNINGLSGVILNSVYDRSDSHMFKVISNANIELTDANGQQSWVYLEPKVLQTGTAAFDGIYLNINGTVTDTYGDGSTGDGNNLLRLADNGTTKFRTDLYGYTKQGSTSASLADDAVFTTTIPDSWTGIVIVQNVTDTTSGVYHLDGTAITAINQNAAFTITQGTNDKTNVYVAGNVLTVENTHAAAKTVKVMFIGT